MNIYYLGPKGSYSYSLVLKVFPDQPLKPCPTFNQVMSAVLEDEGSIGVLGIENSISSSVHESVDLIFDNEVYIVGEACMDIQLHLIGTTDAEMGDIKEIFSYPQALAQCSQFIKNRNLHIHETPSTMAAVREVDTLQDHEKAAIAGRGSLADTNLSIIQENIGNTAYNMTRWVFISKKPKNIGKLRNKVTYIFKVKHEPGSLVRVLQSIAQSKGNMTKIESRPVPGSNWEYAFWIDVELQEGTVSILDEVMKRETVSSRVVGVYEKGRTFSE